MGQEMLGLGGFCVLSAVFIKEMTTRGCRSIRKVVADIHYIRLHVCAHREGDLSQTGLGCVKFVSTDVTGSDSSWALYYRATVLNINSQAQLFL